jgi:hypothetical protein
MNNVIGVILTISVVAIVASIVVITTSRNSIRRKSEAYKKLYGE